MEEIHTKRKLVKLVMLKEILKSKRWKEVTKRLMIIMKDIKPPLKTWITKVKNARRNRTNKNNCYGRC